MGDCPHTAAGMNAVPNHRRGQGRLFGLIGNMTTVSLLHIITPYEYIYAYQM